MKIGTFVILAVVFGQLSLAFGQEKLAGTDSWYGCNHAISIAIINKADLGDAKMSAVKNAVFSQDNFVQDDSIYFKGWAGALKSIGSGYSFELSNSSNADITVTLTKETNPEYSGWATPHYVSGRLSSDSIVIYDANKIQNAALENLVRHEMGHALGLSHTTAISSIMNPILPYTPKYISGIDLDRLESNLGNPLYLTSRCM